MANTKISALDAIASIAGEDLFAAIDDPSGTPISKKATITQLATFLRSLSETLTNKTIDADNNTISNLGDSEVSGISASKINAGQLALARGGTGQDFSSLSGNANKVIAVNSGETALELAGNKKRLSWASRYDVTSDATTYIPHNSFRNATTTESNVSVPFFQSFTVKRLVAVLESNNTTSDSTLAFRDDSTDAQTLNLGQTTGEKDSGDVSVSVDSGSKLNFAVTHGSNAEISGQMAVEVDV